MLTSWRLLPATLMSRSNSSPVAAEPPGLYWYWLAEASWSARLTAYWLPSLDWSITAPLTRTVSAMAGAATNSTTAAIAANIISFLICPSLLSSVHFPWGPCYYPIRWAAPRKWAKGPKAVWAFVPAHVPAIRPATSLRGRDPEKERRPEGEYPLCYGYIAATSGDTQGRGRPQVSEGKEEQREPMVPGDKARPGTDNAGEDLCPRCGGTGRDEGKECEN